VSEPTTLQTASGAEILDELRWRGLVALSTDEDALRSALDAGPVTFYCGFDPSAPSLHMGNLVQLLTMRRLQNAGHRPIALVGGSTGLIGDPKPTAERVLNPKELVAAWVEQQRRQVGRFLSFEGDNAAVVVNNLDWTAPMSALDFLRDIGKHYRVNTMIRKDAVADRLASHDGISYTEFSYQILQGLDFLELYRRHGCILQTGGSDQWGNLTSGVDLIHRAEGVSVHALATPLITKADGTKYGKTESGTVWLDPEMTSPYAFFQFWLNAEDAIVGGLLRVFTFRSRSEIEALEEATRERPQLREAQRALARDVTTLVHGAETTERVEAASRALFGRDGSELASLDGATLRDATAELPRAEGTVGDRLVDLMAASGLVTGRNAARRAVAEGGAYLNNGKVTDPDQVLTESDILPGGVALLRRGRRSLAAVTVRGSNRP
jgi:tyrosyl-tRNA synthetase